MNQPIERLLVLYTGGTIGMQQSAAGLMPASGFEARMREQQEGQRSGAVGQGIGAVQQQHRIAVALRHGFADGGRHLQLSLIHI